jgi:predicted SprT family Zn-dependent metalloprotease
MQLFVTELWEDLKSNNQKLESWTLRENARLTRLLGRADFTNKEICLSRNLLQNGSLDLIEEVLKHEVAHVNAGLKAGHGEEWQAAAKELGIVPREKYPEQMVASIAPKPRWLAFCPSCGSNVGSMLRKPSSTYQHVTCQSKIVWNRQY